MGDRDRDGARTPRRRWVFVVSLVAAVVLIAGFAVVRGRLDGWARRQIETRLARAIEGNVSIAKLHVRLLRLEISFSGLRASADHGAGLEVEVPRGRVRLAWSGLAAIPAGRIRLAELELTAPSVSVVQGSVDASPAATESRKIEWRIGHVVVHAGRLRYEELETPLEVDASDVEIQAEWNRFRRAIVGRVSATVDVARPPLARPLPVTVRAGVRLRGTRLEVFDASAEGAGLSADGVEGHVLLEPGLALALRGRFEADLSRFRDWLPPDAIAVAGRLRGEAFLDGGEGTVRIGGGVEGQEVKLGPLAASAARGRVEVRPGGVVVDELEADAYGGRVRGRVAVEFADVPRFEAGLEGAGLDAHRLAQLAGQPLAIAGSARVQIDVRGEAGRPSTWTGSGRLDATPVAGGSELLPVRAAGPFRLDDGVLRVTGMRVEAAAAVLSLSARLSLASSPPRGEVRLEGETSSVERSRAGLLVALRGANVEIPEILERRARGHGTARVQVTLGERPELDVRLAFEDGEWAGLAFRRADVDLASRGGVVELRRVTLHGGGGSVELSGRIDLVENSVLDLRCTAENVDIAPLASLLHLPVEAGGRLSGEVVLAEQGHGLEGSGGATIQGLDVSGQLLGRLEARFESHRGVMDLGELHLEAPGLTARGQALVDLTTGTFEGDLSEGRVDLSEFELLRRAGLPAEGEALLSGSFRRTPAGVLGTLQITGPSWKLAGFDLGRVEGDLRFRADGVDFQVSTGKEHGLSLEGRAAWSEGVPVSAVLYLDGAVVEIGQDDVRTGLWARLNGRLTVEGPAARPRELRAQGSLESAQVQLGTRTLETAAAIALAFEEGRVSVGPVSLRGPESSIEAEGEYVVADRRVRAECRGTLDLGALAAAVPAVRASGPMQVDLDVSGTTEALDVRGSLELPDGRARLLGFPVSLDAISGRIELQGQKAVLERFRAVVGGGEITGSGEALVGARGLDSYAVDLEVANARVQFPDGFKGAYEGRLSVRGDNTASTLGGKLTLLRGVYSKPFDISGALGYRVREYGAAGTLDLPVKVYLDLDLDADRGVWVKNDLADVETRLDLHFGGDVQRPEVTGRIWLFEGGEVRFRDVEYRIQSGSLDLVELRGINPYVDIRAETSVAEYDVFLHIQGTLDRLQYEVTSDPVLSPQDIIALLATGKTLETLAPTSGGPNYTGDVVANYFASALTQPFEQQLEKLLHIERIRIDPLLVEGQADPTTRITVGKEVSKNVLLVYSTDLDSTEKDIYQVEWKASPKLRLVSERSASGGVGGDVRYTTRFWLRRPPGAAPVGPAREPAVAVPETAGALKGSRVASVRIEGQGEGVSGALSQRVPLRAGQAFDRSSMLEGAQDLRAYYVRQGRIEARVEARAVPVEAPGGGVEVVYRVTPGPQVKIVLEGVKGGDERRLRSRLLGLWLDSIFQEDLYADANDAILDYYRQRGYYAADVTHEQSNQDGVKSVRFRVDPGQPVKVEAVHLVGVEAFPESRVRKQMLTRSDTLFSRNVLVPSILEEDVGAIRTLYRENGYLEVVVAEPRVRLSSRGTSADVTIQVHEGSRFAIGQIDATQGLAFSPDQLVKWSGLQPGEVFAPGRLLEAESALRVRLDERGYPQSRVSSRLEMRDRHVDVHFDVETGDFKRIGAIEIQGNRVTNEKIIRRELLTSVGDPISRDRILQAQHRLYKLGIFRNVRIHFEPMDASDPAKQRVIVEVEEGPPMRLAVGAGYNTEDGVRGTFSISHDNVGGRNRTVGLAARASGIEKRVELVVQDPRLFGRRDVSGLANLFWQTRETVAFDEKRRSLAFRVSQEISKRWSHFLRYSFQRVDLTDVQDSAAVIEQKLDNLALGDLGYGVTRSTRDDLFSPTRGTYATGELRIFTPALLSDVGFARLFLQGSGVWTFGNKTQFASAVRLGAARSFTSGEDVPLSERFFAGGDSTLRGFGRDEVGPTDPVTGLPTGGEALFLLNEEFRYPIWKALKGSVFYDAGNVYATVSDLDPTDLRHVLGLGLRLETPLGPLRIEYGRKLDRRAGESLGEFFLAIGNAF